MQEQNIPIDIHLNKLLDWLTSRRICPRDWQKNILVIRQNINDAIQDMPAVDEIAQLLAGTYINYFHCLRIVEILKDTESSSKNIFGMYSSKRMKDWLEIIKLYQKGDIYLAEAAQLLVRNIVYELPSLKRQLTKCLQTQEESMKKETRYAKNEVAMRESYAQACQQIGIEGKNIKKELISLLDDLPAALNDVAEGTKSLADGRDYYRHFLSFTLKKDAESFCLPILRYIIEKGNTTTFEWRTGEAPEIIENTTPIVPVDIESTEAADDQIDFGDFGAPSESSDRSSNSPNGDFVHVNKEDCKVLDNDQIDFADSDINWDITVESGITVEESSDNTEGGKVARGPDALTILENHVTRDLFYADLLELEAFLEQRILESDITDVLSTSLFQNAPSVLQMQSLQNVEKMQANVQKIIAQLMTPKLKHLYLIKGSARYVERLVDSLRSQLESAVRMHDCQEAVKIKHQEAIQEQRTLEPKINLIVEKTKILLDEVEKDISKRYKNRPVNIMGGLSALQQFTAY